MIDALGRPTVNPSVHVLNECGVTLGFVAALSNGWTKRVIALGPWAQQGRRKIWARARSEQLALKSQSIGQAHKAAGLEAGCPQSLFVPSLEFSVDRGGRGPNGVPLIPRIGIDGRNGVLDRVLDAATESVVVSDRCDQRIVERFIFF